MAGMLGGGGTCRLWNRPGELGPRVVSNYEAGTFLSMGEAWLRGVQGEAGWDFAGRSSRRGGGVGGQAVRCLLRLRGRGAGSRAGAPRWLEACNPRAGVEAAERRRRCFPGEDGASVQLSTNLGAGSGLTP